MDVPTPPESINEFTVVGEFGFKRVAGPFDVEKEGTKWTISIPAESDDPSVRTLPNDTGEAAVLIADCESVGGGVVDVVNEPDGEDVIHVVVDQYALGDV